MMLTKLNVFDAMDDGGEASVFATVEWAGTIKRTKMVKKPNLNETLYFHISIEDDIRKDQGKLIDFLNDELQTKAEVTFNVWADTGKVNLENLGSTRLCLASLHSCRFEDKIF